MTTVSPVPSERLATSVRAFMRPGVITVPEHATLLEAKRAMVRHGVHAVLIVGASGGLPLGWVSDDGLLPWLERDLSTIPASHAITEPPHYIQPDDTGHAALEALAKPGVTHLLVAPVAGSAPHGVVAPIDLVELVVG